MPNRRAKRKRGDMEETVYDDSSESGTSQSSYKPSDISEDDSASSYVSDSFSRKRSRAKQFTRICGTNRQGHQQQDSEEGSAFEDNSDLETTRHSGVNKKNSLVHQQKNRSLSFSGINASTIQNVTMSSRVIKRREKPSKKVFNKKESDLIKTLERDKKVKYDKEYILNVCKRLQRGESGFSIAKKLGINRAIVYSWKHRYCTSELPEPTDGAKYDKNTIIRACEMMKSGVQVKDIAKQLKVTTQILGYWRNKYIKKEKPQELKYNSFNTVVNLIQLAHNKRTILEVYQLLRQDVSIRDVAKNLKLLEKHVRVWLRRFFLKDGKGNLNCDEDVKRRVYRRFRRGELTGSIAKEFRMKIRAVNELRNEYFEGITSKFLEKTSDEKLGSDTAVVLTRDWKIDQHCQEQIIHPYTRTGRKADKKLIERALKLLRKGVPSNLVAKECGVKEQLIISWRVKYIPKKERILRKCRKISNEEVIEVRRLLKQGANTAFLAKLYGVTCSTVTGWRYKFTHSVVKNRDMCCNDKAILKACRELKRGASLKSVSLKMGIPFQTVVSWRQRYLLRKVREKTRRGSWKYSRYIRLKAYQLLKRGVESRVIAEKLKVDIDLVRKWKKDLYKYQQQMAGEQSSKSNQLKKIATRTKNNNLRGSTVTQRVKFNRRKQNVSGSGMKRKFKGKDSSKATAFVPMRKVYIPIKMKLQFVKMVDDGIPIKKLSKDLNVNELTLKSWIHNRDLLLKRSNNAA